MSILITYSRLCSQQRTETNMKGMNLYAQVTKKMNCLFQGHYHNHWTSNEFYGSMSIVGLYIQFAALMAGLSYGLVFQMAKSISLNLSSSQTFFTNQKVFALAVNTFYRKQRQKLPDTLRGRPLTIAVDAMIRKVFVRYFLLTQLKFLNVLAWEFRHISSVPFWQFFESSWKGQ